MTELTRRGQQSASIWHSNPVFVHLLGLSPLLAISTQTANALGLAILLALVLIAGQLTIHLLADFIKGTWHFFWTLVILAIFTSILGQYCRYYHPLLFSQLGIYLPLIACNFALLLQLEASRTIRPLRRQLLSSTRLLAGYTLALVLFAALREALGGGPILQNLDMLIPGSTAAATEAAGGPLADFMALPATAFMLLGLVVALYNWLRLRMSQTADDHDRKIEPAPRARVTEKLNP